MKDLAEKVAARYAARCWWADRDDLVGTALLAGVEASRTFDPAVGVDRGAYLWRSMLYACKRHLWGASAPVSAGSHHQEELAGLHRAELDDALVDPLPTPHQQLEREEWALAVREHATALAQHLGHELALPVLLSPMTPAEVARACDVPVKRVYRARQYLKEAMANDLTLYNLWKDMP